jgi:hypothetical protein
MTTLTITSEDQEAIDKVKKLAKKLHVSVSEVQETTGLDPQTEQMKRLKAILDDWHKHGGMKTDIKDPLNWQREMRKDRDLPFIQ